MDGKKISFGFKAKLKSTNLTSVPVLKKPDHELIECLEGQSIKIFGKEEDKPKLLVIPLKSDSNATKRIAHTAMQIINEEQGLDQETVDDLSVKPIEPIKPSTESNETLEQKATREILASLTQENELDDTKIYSLPINADELPLEGAAESTIDDYENIPIKDFGLALLRGMGWKDEEKKKNELKLPPLRPKGMGLGADKLAKPKELLVKPAHNEVLEIKKNAYVKIITGKHKNLYGQIEGMDDDSGRINIVLSIGGAKISLNEFTVQVVSKEEWVKYGKILNSAQFDEYKYKDLKTETKVFIKQEPPEKANSNSKQQERTDSKSGGSSYKDVNSRIRQNKNYSDDDNDNSSSRSSDKRKQQEQTRSSSSSKYHHHKSRYQSSSESDSDSEAEPERRNNEHSSKHKKSSKSKKSHDRQRSRSRDRQSRRYSSEESSDDQKYHHKKKTKKSKKPRSRSRTRR